MHLIDTKELSKTEILSLFETANTFKENPIQPKLLQHKTIAMLFFEASTRTRCSFELAAKRLGATVLHVDITTSSTQKGESLLDTVWTLEAMDVDAFIVRHKEENICQQITTHLKTKAIVINAGNGTETHPTQALLDAYTIQSHQLNFEKLIIAIVGDIRHSRVAHSNIQCLKTLGVTDIRLIAPKEFFPTADLGCKRFTEMNEGLKDCDVIMMLRMQTERMGTDEISQAKQTIKNYALTIQKLKLAKSTAIVMHPGPLNRGIEITDEVADGPQSVILEQVQNGVFMRQAILAACLRG